MFKKHRKRNQKTQLDLHKSCSHFETYDKNSAVKCITQTVGRWKYMSVGNLWTKYWRCQSSRILFVNDLLGALNTIFHRNKSINHHPKMYLKCIGFVLLWFSIPELLNSKDFVLYNLLLAPSLSRYLKWMNEFWILILDYLHLLLLDKLLSDSY